MPRFTPNQMFKVQNKLNLIKREMNKPSTMSLNQYFEDNSVASVKRDPRLLKLRPSQFHNKNEWDGDIMRLEYTINKESILREHFNEPDETLQNYNIPLPVDKQNKLMKSINNIIREVQKSITEDNLGTTYLNIVKLFNDFSLTYNSIVTQIKDDKNFQLIFNERLITLEDLIRTCLQTATIGRYDMMPKSNYRYSTTEFLNAFQDIIKIIGEMLITKNISMFIGDSRPSQITVEPTVATDGTGDDMRDDMEEIERLRRERDDGDHGDHFKRDREEGIDEGEGGVEERKGPDEGMVSVVIAYKNYKQKQNAVEGVDDGEDRSEDEITDNVRRLTYEELKNQYLMAVNNFIDVSNEIKSNDEDPNDFIEQIFNPIFRMNLDTIDEVLDYLEKIRSELTGRERFKDDVDKDTMIIKNNKQRRIIKKIVDGYLSLTDSKKDMKKITDKELIQEFDNAITYSGTADVESLNFIFDIDSTSEQDAREKIEKIIEELNTGNVPLQDFKAKKTYFNNQIKTVLLPLLNNIKITNIKKNINSIINIEYSGLEQFEKKYKLLFQRIINVFYDIESYFKSGQIKDVYETNGENQRQLFIIKIINEFVKNSKIKISRTTKTENLIVILNNKIENKIKTENMTEFNIFLNGLRSNDISLFDYEKFNFSELSKEKVEKINEVLEDMQKEGF
jgi:hypothetical protein